MSFGFPIDALPVSDCGELKRERHRELLKAKRKCEVLSLDPVLIPSNNDILFGRGKPYQKHPGNLRLGLVVESLAGRYGELSNKEKTALAQEVLTKMKNAGIKFLKQVDGVWQSVDDSCSREKISNTFRSIRLSKVKQQGKKRARVESGKVS